LRREIVLVDVLVDALVMVMMRDMVGHGDAHAAAVGTQVAAVHCLHVSRHSINSLFCIFFRLLFNIRMNLFYLSSLNFKE